MNSIYLYLSKAFVLLIVLSFFGCKKDFTNKKIYNIRIGEKVKLYISQNSCSQNCWLNKSNIKSIEFVGQKLAETSDKECDCRTSYYSWEFKGIKVGKDTIKVANISGGRDCSEYKSDSSKIQADIFVINVSQ